MISVDSQFAVWTGGYCCPGETVAVLVCVIRSGHHIMSTYQWHKDREPIIGEDAPVLYSDFCGVFMCAIQFLSETKEYSFTVRGITMSNQCTT